MKMTIKEARDYAFKVALKKGATKQEVRRGLGDDGRRGGRQRSLGGDRTIDPRLALR